MKILVRLPNWLGDMVMSVGMIHQLKLFFPQSSISVIVKRGLQDILPFFPPTAHQFIFSKDEHQGLRGIWKFGRQVGQTEDFDLFISLPDSFSSALMGLAAGAKKRIGYKKELRNFLLTHSYVKPKNRHRVEEYLSLLELYTKQKTAPPEVRLQHSFKKENYILVNPNSEAQSRRLTVAKAVELLNDLRLHTPLPIYLIGAPKEKPFTDEIYSRLSATNGIENKAGQTPLSHLIPLLASAQLMLSTDSGPAHLANALGTKTVVLFGAGNENNTAPYNEKLTTVLRLGKLSCEPCLKNVCVKYETPQCLVQMGTEKIVQTVTQKLQDS